MCPEVHRKGHIISKPELGHIICAFKIQVSEVFKRNCDFSTITQMALLTCSSRFYPWHHPAHALRVLLSNKSFRSLRADIIIGHYLVGISAARTGHWGTRLWKNTIATPDVFRHGSGGRQENAQDHRKHPSPSAAETSDCLLLAPPWCLHASSRLITINKYLSLW